MVEASIFRSKMGISLLCIAAGMITGTSVDFVTFCWDATTSAGRQWLHSDLKVEDPYLIILTQPCASWHAWSRFNISKEGAATLTVESLREDGRKTLP